MFNKRYIGLSLFLFFTGLLIETPAFSQTPSESVRKYFEMCSKGQSTTAYQTQLLHENVEKIINETSRFTTDSLAKIRFAAYSLIGFLAQKTEDSKLKQNVVKKLIVGSKDKDGGVAGNCLQLLTQFKEVDFDVEAKYNLSEMALKPRTHYETVIKICGWLNQKDLCFNFRKAIDEKQGDVYQRWAMRLAMARMGDVEMINYCLARLQKIGVNDDIVSGFFPDMVYTRQKALFDPLLAVIESDKDACSSSNPDSEVHIVCAFRVIELLAPYINGFPAKVDRSGSLISNNYDQTLKEVRTWIQQNRNTYTIVNDGF